MVAGSNGFNSIRSNIEKMNGTRLQTDTGKIREKSSQSIDQAFSGILQEKLDQSSGIKFSKHAELRMQSRNINLTSSQKEKMGEAVKKAEAKGVKDSLVLMDNMAFVVNVRSRTVITAANNSELKENVFTNIDGTVIV